MPKSIYLASDYGFSRLERELVLPPFVDKLTALGLRVHEPFSEMAQVTYARAPGWAYRVGQADFAAVRETDAIFAIVNGCPPDEGVMVELGMAIALGKKTFLYRDDFRRSSDADEYPLNLMLFTGLPRDSWRDSFYTSIEELDSPEKSLRRWLEGRL